MEVPPPELGVHAEDSASAHTTACRTTQEGAPERGTVRALTLARRAYAHTAHFVRLEAAGCAGAADLAAPLSVMLGRVG